MGLVSTVKRPDRFVRRVGGGALKLIRRSSVSAEEIRKRYPTTVEMRRLASKFRLDVYSPNPEVREFLITVSEKRIAGKVMALVLTSPLSFTPGSTS